MEFTNEMKEVLGTQALPAVVSFIAGPIMTMIAKRLAAKAGATMSPKAKLAFSGLSGALSALVVGDVNGLAEALGTLLTGLIGGLGGAKGRDIAEGKTSVVKTADLGNA